MPYRDTFGVTGDRNHATRFCQTCGKHKLKCTCEEHAEVITALERGIDLLHKTRENNSDVAIRAILFQAIQLLYSIRKEENHCVHSGIEYLDKQIEHYQKGKINLEQLTGRLWRKAYKLGAEDKR